MTKLILVRHGHVEGIVPERFRGHAEIPLTALGRAQAEATARWIAAKWRVAKVYTGPLGHYIKTGTPIAAATQAPAEVSAGLIDPNYGDWSWKTHTEVQATEPQLYRRSFSVPHIVRIPHGDSIQDLVVRAANTRREALDRHPTKTVVMVGHDSTNRALLLKLLDQPLSACWRVEQSPCGINEIDIVDGVVRIRRANQRSHPEAIDELGLA